MASQRDSFPVVRGRFFSRQAICAKLCGVNQPLDKPLLVFDGDCTFCRRWIARWQKATGDRVDYREFQLVAPQFPDIPTADFEEAVQLIEPGGRVLSGADAVLRTLDFAPKKRWLHRVLRAIPGFMPIARVAYRFIANHRTFFSRFTP